MIDIEAMKSRTLARWATVSSRIDNRMWEEIRHEYEKAQEEGR